MKHVSPYPQRIFFTCQREVWQRVIHSIPCRCQILAESLQKKDLAVLDSLSIEVQHSEQEKYKTRRKQKFDALLKSSEWRGQLQGVRDNASNYTK